MSPGQEWLPWRIVSNASYSGITALIWELLAQLSLALSVGFLRCGSSLNAEAAHEGLRDRGYRQGRPGGGGGAARARPRGDRHRPGSVGCRAAALAPAGRPHRL